MSEEGLNAEEIKSGDKVVEAEQLEVIEPGVGEGKEENKEEVKVEIENVALEPGNLDTGEVLGGEPIEVKDEHKAEPVLNQSNSSKAGKPILKKPGQQKKHIIDDLELERPKHATLPILTVTTPPARLNKDFIKKNILRSTAYLTNSKTPGGQDEAKLNEMLEEAAKKSLKVVDVNERFYKKAEDSKKKTETLKEKIIKEELDACTFQPKTNSKDKSKQNPSDFNKKLDAYIEKKKKRQETAAETKKQTEKLESEETLSHKPTICEKSKKILSKKHSPEEPIYERLYKKHKVQPNKIIEAEKPEKLIEKSVESPAEKPAEKITDPTIEPKTLEEPEVFFHPTINKKSQKLARPFKIEQKLYDDALRRKNKPLAAPTSPQAKYLTSNSERFLIERFKRDFTEALIEIEAQDSAELNYNQLIDLYRCIYFLKEEKDEIERPILLQIWRIFSEDEQTSVTKSEILAVSLAIMGFYEEWMDADPLTIKFSKEEVGKIHKTFQQFYINRTSVTNRSTVNQSFKNVVEHSFQPEMIAQSDELAEKWRSAHRDPGSIEQALISEQAKKEKKIQQLKQKVDAETLKECSFKPKTEELPNIYVKTTKDYSKIIENSEGKPAHKGVVLYTLASKNREKKEKASKTTREMQEEKEMQECTFSPRVLDKKNVGNVNDFVQRMQAREKKVQSPYEKKKNIKSPKATGKFFKVDEEKQLREIKETTAESEISPVIFTGLQLNREENENEAVKEFITMEESIKSEENYELQKAEENKVLENPDKVVDPQMTEVIEKPIYVQVPEKPEIEHTIDLQGIEKPVDIQALEKSEIEQPADIRVPEKPGIEEPVEVQVIEEPQIKIAENNEAGLIQSNEEEVIENPTNQSELKIRESENKPEPHLPEDPSNPEES